MIQEGQCSIERCESPRYARGLCQGHCRRLRLYGDPLGGRKPLRRTPEEALRAGIAVVPETGCWEWQHGRTRHGYGRVGLDGKREVYAHRLAFELWVRPLAPREQVDHLCHNPPCCNPEHLRAGSQFLNQANRRGPRKGSRSGVRNVVWYNATQRWYVKVFRNGVLHQSRPFTDLSEAAVEAERMRAELDSA
jgi:hypothetical protein